MLDFDINKLMETRNKLENIKQLIKLSNLKTKHPGVSMEETVKYFV